MKSNSGDARLRALERRAAQGDPAAAVSLVRARLQSGTTDALTLGQLRLAYTNEHGQELIDGNPDLPFMSKTVHLFVSTNMRGGEDGTSIWSTEAGAAAARRRFIAEFWDQEMDGEEMPDDPDRALEEYEEATDERHSLDSVILHRTHQAAPDDVLPCLGCGSLTVPVGRVVQRCDDCIAQWRASQAGEAE